MSDFVFREERLRFWSDPDTELKLASDTGVQVFRMGVDWTRIIPENPTNGLKETVRMTLKMHYSDMHNGCVYYVIPFKK